MKRWTNGLPGATKRLGAKMALRGLAASQPRMRADTYDGPEQIAPLQRPDTLMQLSRSLILEVHLVPHGRTIHLAQSGHVEPKFAMSAFGGKADMAYLTACCFDPKPTNARWWQHRRGWQRPPDSERCKMGARNALIRKRFYKKRDCKKNSLIQGVARELVEGSPWRVLLVVA